MFVMNNMNIGGTEKSFLNLLDTLPEDRYAVTLLLLEKKGGYYDLIPNRVEVLGMEGYDAIKPDIMDPPIRNILRHFKQGRVVYAFKLAFTHLYYKLSGNRTPYFSRVLNGYRLTGQYDTAIAYCGPFDFITVLVLQAVQAKKRIQWIHFDVSKIHMNVNTCRKLYPQFDKICVVSEEARRAVVALLPELEKKTETRPNVVSEKQCRLLAEQGAGFQDDYTGLRIVTVGRLSKEKGQDIIPAIAYQMKQKGIAFKWYLVGDGQLRKEIERLCDETGTREDIVFLGTQINPYPYLKAADLYVQTSAHEGYCITLAEAKAFGLPIVSTACAGAHEHLDGMANARVVPREEKTVFAAICELLNM